MLIDTHSHIYAEEFDADRDEVVARAEAAGVGCIVLPAIDSKSHSRQEALAMSRPGLFRQMMGLHPTSVGEDYREELETARALLFGTPCKYVAVGEIGLDFYWDTTYRQQQVEVVEIQLGWAEELGLPVALHLRSGKEQTPETDAYAEMFRILDGRRCRGIMHCFSGTLDDALRAVEMGFLLGIGGVVTYKKSTLPDIVRAVPLESIVLETDAPYLAPVPWRGRRNETSYLVHVAQKVAEIKGTTVEEVSSVTTENAKKLFSNL